MKRLLIAVGVIFVISTLFLVAQIRRVLPKQSLPQSVKAEDVFVPGPEAEGADGKKTPKRTLIFVPVLNAVMPNGVNTVYAAPFQIAWENLKNNTVKESISLYGLPRVTDFLNREMNSKDLLIPPAYFAAADFKQENIENKVASAARKNKNPLEKDDIAVTNPLDIVAYGHMFRDIKFDPNFEEGKITFNPSQGTPWEVKAFGIHNYDPRDNAQAEMAAQVGVNYYKDDSYILTINDANTITYNGKEYGNEVILAMLPRERTLAATVCVALDLMNKPEPLSAWDQFLAPEIAFNDTQHYKELESRKVLNTKFITQMPGCDCAGTICNGCEAVVGKALQTTKFILNAEGSSPKAAMASAPSVTVPEQQKNPIYRTMYFDRPFLIMMREPGKERPYFAMWVDNTEPMNKIKPK
ncbi:hypothetical protein AAIR98_001508 [Elusimicrobium simillimum]|uniref:hypothetical protein n=1 Tax=Elusimicrobium simillimum TaxID=3143438 RepID=UPI003C6F2A21